MVQNICTDTGFYICFIYQINDLFLIGASKKRIQKLVSKILVFKLNFEIYEVIYQIIDFYLQS